MKQIQGDYSSASHIPHSRFVESSQKKNGRFNRSSKSGGGVARLWRELQYPFDPSHYSLKPHHLGIDKKFADSKLIYDRKALKAWKMVVKEEFDPPYFFKFEVGEPNSDGELGELHLHIIADVDAGLDELSRDGELVKPISDFQDFRRRVIYLYKLAVPDCEQARREYLWGLEKLKRDNMSLPKSKRYKRLPQTSGFVCE